MANNRLSSAPLRVLITEMKIRPLSVSERLKNSARSSALMLALALVSILVPVAHFILVPGFLLLMLVMGALEFRKKIEVSELSVKCQTCETLVDLSTRTSQDLLMKDCPGCNRQVTFRLPGLL